jgi:four helix bundle protein
MEKPHKNLDAWKLAMDLVVRAYGSTDHFPRSEKFGLVDQMRRAAVSVPCNIAEGAARQTRKEFINFLHVAQGSLSELDTLNDISLRLKYVDIPEHVDLESLMGRVDKTLSGLIRQQRSLLVKR